MHGSVVLSAKAAMKTGCGYTYVLTPKSIFSVVSAHLIEPIIYGINDENIGMFTHTSHLDILAKLTKVDAIAIGMGLNKSIAHTDLLAKIIKLNKPLLIDADGLNSLKNNLGLLTFNTRIILTPHPGELASLLKVDVKEIQANRLYYSELVANTYKVTVILKGHNTIVATNNRQTYINKTGNAGMATAGSGDVLSGIIVALLAQGLESHNAAILGVYLHGLAGDLAKIDLTEYSLIASDLIKYLPAAIKNYLESDFEKLDNQLYTTKK